MSRCLTGREAFTLIELIISMTIVAVILVIIFGAFRVSIRAWEKGEKDIDKQQRYRIVLDLVRRQMISASFKKIEVEDKHQHVLKGDASSFEFLSHVALKPENRFGVVFVQYRVVQDEKGNDSLLAYERNVLFFDKDFKSEHIDPDAFFKLIPTAQHIYFEYLKPAEQDLQEKPQWVNTWDPEHDKGAPAAVKLTVVDQPDNTPLVIITPFFHEEE
jgi:general secretion pathway protein J